MYIILPRGNTACPFCIIIIIIIAYTCTSNIIVLTTNEAVILQLFLFSILLCSEVGKGVNDHTKDEVLEDDDNHYQEEGEVVDESQ